ncbi:hypothetical protein HU200_039857 [Digitaria exilis]|uniref:Uncharacterized protein n=1 Tax=Digitaria exilis TaxID=1010633 RepID=A0A835BLQ3_9POAL|nr:hypothetical protein HU200_039857 [Digitaria exilis]
MDGWPVCQFNEYVQGPRSVGQVMRSVAQSSIDEAILFAQEGRTYDWKWFSGRDELVDRFRCLGQRDKERETRELRDKIRNKYDVPLPDDELLFGTIIDEYIKEKRCRPPLLEAHNTLIKCWRLNRILYPRPLSRDERAEKRRKLEEERHLERQRDAVRAPGSILRKEKDKEKSTGLRVTFALVEPAVNKGKGVVVISSDEDDGWGDDEILSGCESD